MLPVHIDRWFISNMSKKTSIKLHPWATNPRGSIMCTSSRFLPSTKHFDGSLQPFSISLSVRPMPQSPHTVRLSIRPSIRVRPVHIFRFFVSKCHVFRQSFISFQVFFLYWRLPTPSGERALALAIPILTTYRRFVMCTSFCVTEKARFSPAVMCNSSRVLFADVLLELLDFSHYQLDREKCLTLIRASVTTGMKMSWLPLTAFSDTCC